MPSTTGTYKSTQGHSFPPWLTPSPGTRTLDTAHAEAYTRLLTLICNPSVSAVSRPSSSSLNSATKKARALAGQHMPFVLSAYIRAQLDMSLSMKQGIRGALVAGWYAIFDTMTVESRKALGEGLDASGRAILSGLVKDWLRFGKWDGG
jgi:nucleolar pre-ribosomal-associated protein 2